MLTSLVRPGEQGISPCRAGVVAVPDLADELLPDVVGIPQHRVDRVHRGAFVLLFLAFGSGVLPIKAIVTNVLSLSPTFGAPV